jgi:RNA polymerase sigma factor (sigma-70 family)
MTFDNNPGNRSADEELIKGLQQNNALRRKAEEELFNRHAYFIKEGMSRYSLPEEEAFDAYSDTILQAIDNIVRGLFEKRATLKTYLYRIFNNKCVDLIRKKTTNKSSIHQTMPISDMLSMIADSAKTVIQQLIEKTDLVTLKNKMKELGENCRKLLAMFADGYNDKEIAVLMEYKTADVVKTSRLRCLDKLRQLYINKKD